MRLMRGIRNVRLDIAGAIVLIALALLLIVQLAMYFSAKEASEWEAFSAAHNCKKVEHMEGDTLVGVGIGTSANGQVGPVVTVSSTPDKDKWLCDNGIAYWR